MGGALNLLPLPGKKWF